MSYTIPPNTKKVYFNETNEETKMRKQKEDFLFFSLSIELNGIPLHSNLKNGFLKFFTYVTTNQNQATVLRPQFSR